MKPSVARKLNERIRSLQSEVEGLRSNRTLQEQERRVQVRFGWGVVGERGGREALMFKGGAGVVGLGSKWPVSRQAVKHRLVSPLLLRHPHPSPSSLPTNTDHPAVSRDRAQVQLLD